MRAKDFEVFMRAQMASMRRYLRQRRRAGDLRAAEAVYREWVEQHAASFRATWGLRA